jgi:hypothetical protein
MVAGFAFLANLLYGSTVEDFHNLLSSFSTLLRFPLGDFSYADLQTVSWEELSSALCCLSPPDAASSPALRVDHAASPHWRVFSSSPS